MPEIKTRERVKDIKTLDKSAVIGQRMKASGGLVNGKRRRAALPGMRRTKYKTQSTREASLAHTAQSWPFNVVGMCFSDSGQRKL